MMQPAELTVIFPSVNGLHESMRRLEAVEPTNDSARLVVLVLDRPGEFVRGAEWTRFPGVRTLPHLPRERRPAAARGRDLAIHRGALTAHAVGEIVGYWFWAGDALARVW